jgi:O-6-methylguanine DNA methyltransferase
VNSLAIITGDGVFMARYSPSGLCELNFPGNKRERVEVASESGVTKWHEVTTAAVDAILRGVLPDQMPPLDLSGHTTFRRNVWAEMRQISLGQTVSYGELAVRIGQPNAIRAVGGACGANPIPLIIPCHRILAAGQRLGGFSGGLDWKRRLLAIEKVKIHVGSCAAQLRFPAEGRDLAGFANEN